MACPLVHPFDAGLLAVLLALGRAWRTIGAGCRSTLMRSALWQALLSLLWTTLAIALMIHAARIFQRERWFAGFGLLAVIGIKLLIVDLGHSGTGTWTASLIGIARPMLARRGISRRCRRRGVASPDSFASRGGIKNQSDRR